jgi:hypothetical protein
MMSYVLYRIAMTIAIMVFVVLSCCFTNISTAKPAVAAAPVIKLDGRRSR